MHSKLETSLFWKMLQADTAVQYGMLAPACIWLLFLGVWLFGQLSPASPPVHVTNDDDFFRTALLVVTLVGVPIGLWRVWAIQRLFRRGVRVSGRVAKVLESNLSARHRIIHYDFTLAGKEHTVSKLTNIHDELPPVVGSEVELVVDETNPKHIFVNVPSRQVR